MLAGVPSPRMRCSSYARVWARVITSSGSLPSPHTPSFAGRSPLPHASRIFARLSARSATSAGVPAMDATDLLAQVRALVPPLEPTKSKGQAGKVAVIGGCREYTGAPFFAAFSALKVGADLSHVFCTPGAATVIKTYSPELIVHPYLAEIAEDVPQPDADPGPHASRRAAAHASIAAWLGRFDALVVGPGLGRDPLVIETMGDIIQEARDRSIPLVIDADGLWVVNRRPSLVQGYPLAVLTPNAAEFPRLCGAVGVDAAAEGALEALARALGGPVVVRKGGADGVSDGAVTVTCAEKGSLRRAGGQGDVLSGTIAAFVAWSSDRLSEKSSGGGGDGGLPPLLLAAYAGCLTTRLASRRAFEKHGRAMGATDVIAELGRTVDEDLGGGGAARL